MIGEYGMDAICVHGSGMAFKPSPHLGRVPFIFPGEDSYHIDQGRLLLWSHSDPPYISERYLQE